MLTSDQLGILLKKYRSTFFYICIFGLFINILMLTLPLYMMQIFTRVLSSRSIETLLLLSIAAGGAMFIQSVLDLIRSRILVRVGVSLDRGLSSKVLTTMVRAANSSSQKSPSALRDVTELRSFLTGTGIFALFDAPFAPLYVVVIYMLHPILGNIALAGCVLLFTIGYFNELITREPHSIANNASVQALRQADGYLRNADAIESMGMLPSIVQRWRVVNGDTLSALALASERAGILSSSAKFVRMSLQIVLYGAGAYLYIQHEMLMGSMIAAAILMARALAPVEMAIGTWRGLISARSAYQRLNDILSQDAGRGGGMLLPAPKGQLSIERVVVTAPGSDRIILKGVSFQLEAGEVLGVIGPSGAGKTTLGKVIIGVMPPRAGMARLDGANIYDWDSDELGKHLGYVPQDVQLFAGTVADNIARMAIDRSSEDVVAAAKMVGVHDMILRLPQGYDTDVGDSGLSLSAGQRQHIALARAFYGNPRMVVLDEPNSNLDSLSEHALVRAISLAKTNGITLIIVTHRPSILDSADKMLVMSDGAVQMFASREEVMASMTQEASQRTLSPGDATPAKLKIASGKREGP